MSNPEFTLTKEEFRTLKSGDIVLVRDRYIRTIQEGPGDHPAVDQGRRGNQLFVSVSKVSRSWTPSPFTVKMWSEVSRIWKRTGLTNKHQLNCLEYSRLLRMWKVTPSEKLRQEWERQVAESVRLRQSTWRPDLSKPVVKEECLLLPN